MGIQAVHRIKASKACLLYLCHLPESMSISTDPAQCFIHVHISAPDECMSPYVQIHVVTVYTEQLIVLPRSVTGL